MTIDNKFKGLPPGIWRATLRLDQTLPDAAVLESTKSNFDFIELPFNFEVKYATPDSFYIEIINGDERIIANDIKFGIDRKTAKDTVIIEFPVYDTYIKALYEEGIMEGDWYVNYKENYSIPFKAFHSKDYRFPLHDKEPNGYLNGKWETEFDYNTASPWPAIADLKFSDDDKLTGTFKTETGDFRFLEGTNNGEKVQLSCFDGSHAFLFESKLLPDSTMVGKFYSGKHYTSDWIASKNESASLTSAYELTMPVSEVPFTFEFENESGKLVTLNDPIYENKFKIVQIMGTWCPNCRDETKFLTQFAERKPENIEIVSIAFEKYREKEKAWAAINRYKKKMQTAYPILLGGYSSKSEASEVFPTLNKIISYPTLIFLDQDNRIIKIHTGFNGPATDEFEVFKKEFDDIIKSMNS